MKTITFASYYPQTHPKAGQKTYFAEQILNNLRNQKIDINNAETCFELPLLSNYKTVLGNKAHTIRLGMNFQKGELLLPSIWEGIPHQSPLKLLNIPLFITHTWEIRCYTAQEIYIDGKQLDLEKATQLAKNDGLLIQDLIDWILPTASEFEGQIVCWDPNVDY